MVSFGVYTDVMRRMTPGHKSSWITLMEHPQNTAQTI
ncbi:protein of unknown function (plasmid) [Caballeronia sp. S22]